MEARLFCGTSMHPDLSLIELKARGYMRQPIEAKIEDGKLYVLSDALFGPAGEDWILTGWDIWHNGRCFAGCTMNEPVTVEAGAYYRIKGGDVYPLGD